MSTSIFGHSAPKFIGNFGDVDETEVLLNYWTTDSDEAAMKETVIESELEAYRAIIPRGDYWVFKGTVQLHKYGTLTDIRNKFEEIYAFNRKKVVLYRHRDGEPMKDEDGEEVLFYLTVTAKHFASLDFKDLLVLEFRSLKGVTLSNGLAVYPAIDEIGMA